MRRNALLGKISRVMKHTWEECICEDKGSAAFMGDTYLGLMLNRYID